MRRFILVLLATGLLVATAPVTSGAASYDAAEFAADCNDDSRVDVSGNVRVRGGVGVVVVPQCDVFLAEGAKLVLRGVVLAAVGNLVTWGGLDSTLNVVDSTISASGILELKTTCCFDEPGVPVNGLTRIISSNLTGGDVYLSSAVAESGGRLIMKGTTVTSLNDIVIPVGGDVRINDNVMASVGDVVITGHDVKVKGNDFGGVLGTVTVSSSGPCTTGGNNPPVTCS